MKRFFQLEFNENIIFTDWFDKNIQFNLYYEKWWQSSFNKDWFTYLKNPINFYRKRWKTIEQITLSCVKYSGWQEIEATETIINQYFISNLKEISEDKALEILKEESLDFSELYDNLA